MKYSYKSDIKLGEEYKDIQTGIKGIATAVYFYLHGCERVNLEVVKDGEIKEYTFDSPRMVSVKTNIKATTNRTGGPAKGNTSRPSGSGTL